jgi:8-oxo-dGTP pyrophosphatase MutT (NUDIX family)
MVKYTVGIYFDVAFKKVALILKNRPDWQAGKWNFPGGKVEETESSQECMSREFNEECGVKTRHYDWNHIGCIRNEDNYVCEVYTMLENYVGSDIFSAEDQSVEWFSVNDLPKNIISNLTWLIPFALNWWKQGNIDHLNFGTFYYSSYENKLKVK